MVQRKTEQSNYSGKPSILKTVFRFFSRNVYNFIIHLLVFSDIFRTSWFMQSSLQYGSKHVHIFKEHAGIVLGEKLPDIHAFQKNIGRDRISRGIQRHFAALHRLSIHRPEDVLSLNLLNVRHFKDIDRCKKMKKKHYLPKQALDNFRKQTTRDVVLLRIKDEVRVQSRGSNFLDTFSSESGNIFKYLENGYFASRKSLELRVLTFSWDGKNQSFQDITASGTRSNIKVMCPTCNAPVVTFSFNCQISGFKNGSVIEITKSIPSPQIYLNYVSLGLIFKITSYLRWADFIRTVIFVYSLCYWIFYIGYGAVYFGRSSDEISHENSIIDSIVERNTPRLRSTDRINSAESIPQMHHKVLSHLLYCIGKAFPKIGGKTKSSIRLYLWQQNSLFIQLSLSIASILDTSSTISVVRESYNFAMRIWDWVSIYWISVYGTRTLPILILILRLLKMYSGKFCNHIRLAATNFYGLHFFSCFFAIFMTKFTFALVFGADFELTNHPEISDSLQISFWSDFYRLQIYALWLSVLATTTIACFINYMINKRRIQRCNWDRFACLYSSLVNGGTGLDKIIIDGQVYVQGDINALTTLHWILATNYLSSTTLGSTSQVSTGIVGSDRLWFKNGDRLYLMLEDKEAFTNKQCIEDILGSSTKNRIL